MSRRVLFATSNGTGLGHLNRAMAIARRLPDDLEPAFFTLSQAAPVVAEQGYDVDYLASYRRPASGTDRAWNLRLRAVLERLLDERRPDLVVFDGVHPYRALTHVLSRRGAPRSLWCRRAMWRAGSGEAPLGRAGAFDAVLEPGELAEGADRGPTVGRRAEAARVDPIVLLDPGELLDRERAAAELGLDPSRRTALVALGQGRGLGARRRRSRSRRSSSRHDLQVAVLRSSLAPSARASHRGRRHRRATFPMSRYFRAFDLAIAARRLQRLPRADRPRRPDPVRADGARHRRPGTRGRAGRTARGPGWRSAARGPRLRDRSAGAAQRARPSGSASQRRCARASRPATERGRRGRAGRRAGPRRGPRPSHAAGPAGSTAGCGSRPIRWARRCPSSWRSAAAPPAPPRAPLVRA